METLLRRALMAALILIPVISPASAAAGGPASLSVSFEHGARLGGSTGLRTVLQIDLERQSSPLTRLQLFYPESLGVILSGLGQATCRRPPSDFASVIMNGASWLGLAGCPRNAVLGDGTALASIRFGDGSIVSEKVGVTLLSGPVDGPRLRLVVFADAVRPFGGKLAYAGDLTPARSPFGGALDVYIPQIPALIGMATVDLTAMHIDLGSSRLVYYERRGRTMVPYHPQGIALPRHCPKAGFRFLALLSFADGSHARLPAGVPCPGL